MEAVETLTLLTIMEERATLSRDQILSTSKTTISCERKISTPQRWIKE
jgi:hypothetical protein